MQDHKLKFQVSSQVLVLKEHIQDHLKFERSWSYGPKSEGYKPLNDLDYEDLGYKWAKLMKVSDSEGHVSKRRLWSDLSFSEEVTIKIR